MGFQMLLRLKFVSVSRFNCSGQLTWEAPPVFTVLAVYLSILVGSGIFNAYRHVSMEVVRKEFQILINGVSYRPRKGMFFADLFRPFLFKYLGFFYAFTRGGL